MLNNPVLLSSKVYKDSRGYFSEVYKSNSRYFNKLRFVQDNISFSKKGVIRGLHFQLKKPQTKFITVIEGKILDVVMDLRSKSKNFGNIYLYRMSYNKNNQILVPRGFAHGFQCLSDSAIIYYKCDNYYYKNDQHGISIDDKNLNIHWPIKKKILSNKDKLFPSFDQNKKYF
jgi:dTDP-4-dehydrorhamnose 3,5-epimerase